MRAALQLAFVDSVNLLLIGVIVAVGIVAPARNRRSVSYTHLTLPTNREV